MPSAKKKLESLVSLIKKGRTLTRCPDCDAPINSLHSEGCDVERCLKCGGQRLSCNCMKTKKDIRQRWSGEWPDLDACRKFNLWCKMDPNALGIRWIPCDKDDPEASEDLNALAEKCKWDQNRQEWVLRPKEKTMKKNAKSVATLTPAEDKAWVDAFNFAKDQGKTDLQADAAAAKEVCRQFPRLKKFRKFAK